MDIRAVAADLQPLLPLFLFERAARLNKLSAVNLIHSSGLPVQGFLRLHLLCVISLAESILIFISTNRDIQGVREDNLKLNKCIQVHFSKKDKSSFTPIIQS